MDAHKIILTTFTRRQLLELKTKYRKELQKVYGVNHSSDPEESFENFVLFLAKLAFLGFTTVCMVCIVMTCGTFIQNGFSGGIAMLVISVSLLLISMIVKKMRLKIRFATVISLLIIYWKTKIYKISTPDLE